MGARTAKTQNAQKNQVKTGLMKRCRKNWNYLTCQLPYDAHSLHVANLTFFIPNLQISFYSKGRFICRTKEYATQFKKGQDGAKATLISATLGNHKKDDWIGLCQLWWWWSFCIVTSTKLCRLKFFGIIVLRSLINTLILVQHCKILRGVSRYIVL